MKRILLGTTALAFAGAMGAGQASAADKLSVGVSGYLQQWVGFSSVEDTAIPANEGGVAQHSDTEVHFRGKVESDNGLTFSIKVELEGNSGANSGPAIDESQLTVSGDFGAVTLGAEDPVVTLTHHGVRDAGFGMICGDFGHWINGIKGCGPGGVGTAGHALGDKNNVTYFSPVVNGVQFGVTYVPHHRQEDRRLNQDPSKDDAKGLVWNDDDAWSVGGNYKGEFGGANVVVSLGHYERSQVGGDDYTYSNFGLNVGMDAFSFDVAYAVSDGAATDGGNTDVVAAGVMYTDGPMAISLGQTLSEADDGDEQTATLLSASYALAPGIAWRSSLFAAERDRGTTDSNAGHSVDGNGFVTGITIGF